MEASVIQETIIRAVCAALAAVGFGAVSNPSYKSFGGIAGLAAVGYAVRYLSMTVIGIDIATSTLLASLVIGFGSLWVGSVLRCPMTTLYIPALLPMVPGMFAYKAVFSIILFMQNYTCAETAAQYLNSFFLNTIITISVMACMTVGASLPMFIFTRKAKQLTRYRNRPSCLDKISLDRIHEKLHGNK